MKELFSGIFNRKKEDELEIEVVINGEQAKASDLFGNGIKIDRQHKLAKRLGFTDNKSRLMLDLLLEERYLLADIHRFTAPIHDLEDRNHRVPELTRRQAEQVVNDNQERLKLMANIRATMVEELEFHESRLNTISRAVNDFTFIAAVRYNSMSQQLIREPKYVATEDQLQEWSLRWQQELSE